jgi:plastocyanin
MSRVHRVISIAALAVLPACGSDGGTDITPPSTPPANTVSIVNGAETKGTAAFTPNPLTVTLASGGRATWRNDDRQASAGDYGGSNGTIHNITSDDLTFSSGSLVPGTTFQHTFDAAGTFGYHCSIHPAMKGTVTVTP